MRISKHAGQQAVARGVSQATIKMVLNEGQVVSRANGLTTVRNGRYTVITNSKTGVVVTVAVKGGGGGW